MKLKKGKKIYSILNLKCPKCHEGDLFIKKGWFRATQMLDMPEHCPSCNQKYEIEPGFWLGALWTSYPLVVLIEIPFLFTAILVYDINPFYAIGLMAFLFLIMWSTILRLGRAIWINLSVHFDEAWKEGSNN